MTIIVDEMHCIEDSVCTGCCGCALLPSAGFFKNCSVCPATLNRVGFGSQKVGPNPLNSVN